MASEMGPSKIETYGELFRNSKPSADDLSRGNTQHADWHPELPVR